MLLCSLKLLIDLCNRSLLFCKILQDTEDSPEPVSGWSPERAKKFGASVLGPIYEVLPVLRDVPKPNKKDQ